MVVIYEHSNEEPMDINRVDITPEATNVLRQLVAEHGPVMFHQSGGCCDGSAPMCYPTHEFKIGNYDVHLGDVDGMPVYIGGQQFALWEHTQLLIDVVPGRGSGFSLEAPLGVRFLTRSRVFNEEEKKWLDACPPRVGPAAEHSRG